MKNYKNYLEISGPALETIGIKFSTVIKLINNLPNDLEDELGIYTLIGASCVSGAALDEVVNRNAVVVESIKHVLRKFPNTTIVYSRKWAVTDTKENILEYQKVVTELSKNMHLAGDSLKIFNNDVYHADMLDVGGVTNWEQKHKGKTIGGKDLSSIIDHYNTTLDTRLKHINDLVDDIYAIEKKLGLDQCNESGNEYKPKN